MIHYKKLNPKTKSNNLGANVKTLRSSIGPNFDTIQLIADNCKDVERFCLGLYSTIELSVYYSFTIIIE